jgi:hypothetical protein
MFIKRHILGGALLVLAVLQVGLIVTGGAQAIGRGWLGASGDSQVKVLTYTTGGPRHAKNSLVSGAKVSVRAVSSGWHAVKSTTKGEAVFAVRAGTYRVEAALTPPSVSRTIKCGSGIRVRAQQGRQAVVKLYCSIP